MSRKRILQGLAAVSFLSFLGGSSILIAGASTASAARTAGTSPSTVSTTTTAPVPSTTSTTSAPATTTTTRAASSTTTAKATGPGTVQLLELPSGDADAKTREVWVYRPAVPDSADLPVVYLLHGYPGTDR